MVVGIYIRVSTDEQVQEGYSISAQRERLKAFCVAQNWDDYKFYIDEGISGRNTKRPQLQKLLDDVKQGSINVLLVYRLDRLTRSVRDLHGILDYLDKYNCVFRSATEIYDTSNAMGRMFITIIAAIAEWESANLGERVKMGMIEKARQGERAGQAPYGWYKDEHGKLHINTEQIQAVKLMITKIKEGYSFLKLSKYMNATNYKPKRGYKWHANSIQELLHNPVLYGAMSWSGEVYENVHEGIITKEEFEELQRIVTSRKQHKKREVQSHFVYQMKLVCPDCGNRLSSERKSWEKKDGSLGVSHIYRCHSCVYREVEHPPFSISESNINKLLVDYMKNIVLVPTNVDTPTDDTEKLRDELSRIERQREKYQRAWASDFITDDEFGKLMGETRVRLEELQRLLSNEKNIVNDINTIQKHIEMTKIFNENFQLLTQEEKQSFIQTFVDSIEIEIKRNGHKRRDMNIKIKCVLFY